MKVKWYKTIKITKTHNLIGDMALIKKNKAETFQLKINPKAMYPNHFKTLKEVIKLVGQRIKTK